MQRQHVLLRVGMVVHRKHHEYHCNRVLGRRRNRARHVMDVLAITGDDTSAPIVQSNGSESGCHSGFCTTNSETASANLTSAPAAGDVSRDHRK